MTTSTLTRRARPTSGPARLIEMLDHPVAFVATALVLLAIFSATFIADPGRAAPADDPAYYTWRTELLMSDGPDALLSTTGPLDMFSSGYRVSAVLLGGLFREVAGVATLTQTIWLMVGLRVLIPLLLGAFVYRLRRDPVAFHIVAFTAASLMLTPPLGGYLDNVLTLLFLSAAAFLLTPAATSWTARLALCALLLASGFTHPTTLAIFVVVLGIMALARVVFRQGNFRARLLAEAPMLISALAAAALTYLLWKAGIWGPSASLGEAAQPPPAGTDFFGARLRGWLSALRPALNGPLFLLGAVALLIPGRRWVDDDLGRLGIVWLLPLLGIFGFAAGLAYPYYRFLNTTLSWVLLTGVGMWIAARYFLARRVLAIGLVALGAVVVTNFLAGFAVIHWNDSNEAWVTPSQQRDLDALRSALADEDGPVVFVTDTDAQLAVRMFGHVKLVGNVARLGVPARLLDDVYVCLGDPSSCSRREPIGPQGSYRRELSQATVEHLPDASEPIYVVASAFNQTGVNMVGNVGPVPSPRDGRLWALTGGHVLTVDGVLDLPKPHPASPWRVPLAMLGLLLLAVPGWLALRAVLPDAGLPAALGLVPTLSAGLLVLSGVVVVAVTRGPFGTGSAWITLGLAVLAALGLRALGMRRVSEPAEPAT